MSGDSGKRLVDDHDYFMGIAVAVRKRANCHGNRVGAVIVLDGRVVCTGYNGTPQGMPNCLSGGCDRCGNRDKYPSGTAYDLCLCVHAEQNALLMAARFGISVQGGAVYTTMRPCFGCIKEMLQANIQKVFYLHEWVYPDADVNAMYEVILRHFPGGVHKLSYADPDAAWAVSRLREGGHSK